MQCFMLTLCSYYCLAQHFGAVYYSVKASCRFIILLEMQLIFFSILESSNEKKVLLIGPHTNIRLR